MRIAICDDTIQDLHTLSALLDAYCISHPFVTYDCYSSATELLCSMPEHDYQVLLLDILMPGLNGIELASEIRQQNKNIKIVFLSSSPEYAVDSYAVNAFYYLLKPLSADKLYPILNRLLDDFAKPAEVLNIKTPQHIFSIPFSKIELCRNYP